MRYMVVLLALTLTTAAEAEQRQRGSRPARNTQTPRAAALSRNIPPRLLLPAGSDRFPTGMRRSFFPGGRRPGFHKPGWSHSGPWYPYFGGSAGGSYFGYSDYYAQEYRGQAAPAPEPEAASRITGMLRLEITPATGLQYYVDGLHIGSSSELGTEFEVNAGARRIEIRAEGYQPVVFDARFVPGETITRRGALERVQATAALPRATGSRTMYVIPGCFMGNARPEPGALPKGCDIRRLTARGGS